MRMTSGLIAGAFLAGASVAAAADPKQADFDACNRLAQSKLGSPSASPESRSDAKSQATARDPQAAPSPHTASETRGQTAAKSHTSAAAPQAAPSPQTAGEARVGSQADPLRGIADASKDDPTYQQAYRYCMKARGF
jgi:hypothetical protein